MQISDKAMRGRNGFLFLNGKDSNNLVEHLQGVAEVLPSAYRVHEMNRRLVENLEIPFLGIVVPEAHCVYPEELPDGVNAPTERRPVNRVLSAMASGYVYALNILKEYKLAGGTVFTGRDSHWTQPAALETYRALRGTLGRSHEFQLSYEPRNDAEVGDLAIGLRDHVIAAERLNQSQIRLGYRTLFASNILNHGNITILHNENGNGRCLAFGTSFSTRLVPAYASDFREVIFCYGTTIDPFMIDLVRPDCVISELPERLLHFPALAVRGGTLVALVLGLSEQRNPTLPTNLDLGTEGPSSLNEITKVIGSAASLARVKTAGSLLKSIESVDLDLGFRFALLMRHLNEPNSALSLRLLLSGQFYNRIVIRKASEMIDSGQLGLTDVPLLPDSENALLAKIRIYLRAGLPGHAAETLARTTTMFGDSHETEYYRDYLAKLS